MQIARCLFLLVALSLSASIVNAQTFRAGASAGLNFSQLEGDDTSGFRKLGITAGILLEIPIRKRWSLGYEINFSRRGSKSFEYVTNFKVVLDYLELPLYASYHDNNGMIFSAGIAPARNFTAKYLVYESGWNEIEYFGEPPLSPLKRWDIGILGNVAYQITPASRVNLRWTFAFTRAYTNHAHTRLGTVGVHNNNISIKWVLVFTAIGKDNRRIEVE